MNGTDCANRPGEDVRTMLAAGSSDLPPGIGLLRGLDRLRRQQAPARQRRPQVPACAAVSR